MMKDLIPIDVLLSSFGSIEGGIIILNPEGKVVYLNDWVLDHGVMQTEDYLNKTLDAVFLGSISGQLLESIDNAMNSSLSRILSHKIHKNILPLYRNKEASVRLPLHISTLISPLKDKVGILIRIVDYTSLVKREKQIRVNESLLNIERNYFKKASDLSVSLESFIASLIDDISWNVSSISIKFSFLKEGEGFRYPKDNNSAVLKRCEKLIQHKEFEGDSLVEMVESLGNEYKTNLFLVDFSDRNIKGVAEFAKNSEHILDVSFSKTITKIRDLISSLIEWKMSFEKLSYMASHDELTGLFSRSFLMKRFDDYKRKMDAEDLSSNSVGLSLFFVDLNKFKEINDQFGHQFGDKVLIKISQRIKSCLSEDDSAFRIGGDEFLVIRKEATPDDYIETLKSKISSPFLCDSDVISVSASIGHACYPNDGHNLDELIHLADKEMYSEK